MKITLLSPLHSENVLKPPVSLKGPQVFYDRSIAFLNILIKNDFDRPLIVLALKRLQMVLNGRNRS